MISVESLIRRARSTGYGAKFYSADKSDILHAVLVGEVPNGKKEQNDVQKEIIKDVNPSVVLHEFFDPLNPERTEHHFIAYERLRSLDEEFENILSPLDVPHIDLLMFRAKLIELYEHFEENPGPCLDRKIIADSVIFQQRKIGSAIKKAVRSSGTPVLAILSSEHIAPNSRVYDELLYSQKNSRINFAVINQDAELQRRLNTFPAFFQ